MRPEAATAVFRRLIGRPERAAWGVLALVVLLSLARSGASAETMGQNSSAASSVLVGAGDIASCGSTADDATGRLLDGISGTVFTLGDNVYESGTSSEFSSCYQPAWGRHKGRTRPSAGNHDYQTTNASDYFGYFGSLAGDPARGYYSYNLGGWHLVVLNTNCGSVGGCAAGSPQERWLRSDLSDFGGSCTLAYGHHPRFSSGEHGNTSELLPLWTALYRAGAEVVLAGHDHDYERFSRQDPNGNADATYGIRQFVVGTGGAPLRAFGAAQRNSAVRRNDTHGVLKLTLAPGSYSWEFIPRAGLTFRDSGSGSCHAAPQAGLPASPTGLSVSSPTRSTLTLRWTDTSSNESGFKIQRRDPGGVWLEVAVVGANVTSYTSGGLSANTSYTYRVRAYSSAGGSPFSNEASGRTTG